MSNGNSRRHKNSIITRRDFLKISAGAVVASQLAVWGGYLVLSPTPACGDDEPTPAETEGPFFKTKSPERSSLLEKGMKGTKLLVTGTVLSTKGDPIPRALLEFWHADDDGDYDNAGYKCRGHQFADEKGRFSLETIVPGLYPGRTRHIHVKVQPPDQRVLTTQLYFPNEPQNKRDGLYDAVLEMKMKDAKDGKAGTFDFVLKLKG